MRIFYDPKTIAEISKTTKKFAPIISSIGDVVGALSGFQDASRIKEQSRIDAAALTAKAEQEKKLRRRAKETSERQEKLTLARFRAVLAAQSGDLSGANALSFLSQTAGEFAVERFRLLEDADTTIGSLLTEAQNELFFGSAAASAARLKAVSATGKALTLLKGFPVTKKKVP